MDFSQTVCALILWRFGLEWLIGKFCRWLMGKFRQFSTEVSARDMPVVSFPDDNLSKYKWIFAKLGMCIDNVEIWLGTQGEVGWP